MDDNDFEEVSADSLYNNDEPETVVAEPEKEPEAEPEKVEEAETDIKEDAEVVSTPDEPLSYEAMTARLEEVEKKASGIEGAYNAEKTKRQKLEEEKQAERPDVFEDQEGFADSIRKEASTEIQQVKNDLYWNDIGSRHEDAKEVISKFEVLAQEKPWLYTQVDNLSAKGGNPLQVAYDVYQDATKEVVNVDADALKEEHFKEFQEMQKKSEEDAKIEHVKKNIPSNLNKEPSRASRNDVEFQEKSAEDLYN